MHMRIVVTLPVLLLGGTEVQTLQQVRVLVGAGYRVTVCCFYEHDEGMRAEMAKAGARVVLLGADWSSGLWPLLRRLVAFFWHERPDIVHVQYMAPGFMPVIAARLAGVRTVFATVHQPGRPYGRKAHLLLRIAARLCTAFFCNSQAVEKSWFGDSSLFDPAKACTRRHWTIHNAVDVEKIAAIAAPADAPALRREFCLGAGPLIGCVGRLRHEKGQALLLEAFAEMARQHAATLLLVGDGPDREVLECQARRLDVSGRVRFMGRCEPEEVFRLLAVMDVVVVPSLFEGFGLAAVEAMAAGRPVVATAVDGLAEVVEDGVSGFLIPVGDASALAVALCDLLHYPVKGLEMGRQGQERVIRNYSMQIYSNTLLQAYGCLA